MNSMNFFIIIKLLQINKLLIINYLNFNKSENNNSFNNKKTRKCEFFLSIHLFQNT